MGRAERIRYSDSGARSDFTFDGASRLETLAYNGLGANGVSYGLSYNPASQITSNALSNMDYLWTEQEADTISYTPNGLNQYTQVSADTLSYDGQANLTNDGADRLQALTGPSSTRRMLYDGDGLIAEYDGNNVLLRRYVHGPGVDNPILCVSVSDPCFPGAGNEERVHRVLILMFSCFLNLESLLPL